MPEPIDALDTKEFNKCITAICFWWAHQTRGKEEIENLKAYIRKHFEPKKEERTDGKV